MLVGIYGLWFAQGRSEVLFLIIYCERRPLVLGVR